MSVCLIGKSGQQYPFEECLMSGGWNPVAGCYAFARQTLRQYDILYIGKAKSFADRLTNHEKWPQAIACGATHVLACVNQFSEESRAAQEQDLIEYYNPPLNVQHCDPTLLNLFEYFATKR